MRKLKNNIIASLIGTCCIIVLSACNTNTIDISKNESSPTIINYKAKYKAGNIVLNFNTNPNTNPELFIHHTFGSTLVQPSKFKDSIVTFTLPYFIATKSGIVHWEFLSRQKKVLKKGAFTIEADTTALVDMESYLGPRTLQAGHDDFCMLVVIPTDRYDNPPADNLEVTLHRLFKNDELEADLLTKNFIVWKNFYTHTQTGKMLVSSFCKGLPSKEMFSDIYPANAVDFTISYFRNHNYADGNQLTTFVSNVIKDEYGNIIADGSLVEFVIENKAGTKLKTYGASLNGVTTVNMVHPDFKDTWKVTAYINGMAKSNTEILSYEPIINTIPTKFSNNNRTITVTPLTSFMNQFVPEGTIVKLTIFNNSKKIETLTELSKKGKVVFELPKDFYREKSYSFTISCLGLQKQINTRYYD